MNGCRHSLRIIQYKRHRHNDIKYYRMDFEHLNNKHWMSNIYLGGIYYLYKTWRGWVGCFVEHIVI